MFSEQRSEMNEIITKIRAGRLTRRSFLERAAAIGLSSSAAVSLLEACGGSSNSSGGSGPAVSIVWQSEQDLTQTYKLLVDTFNKTVGSKQGIHVTWSPGPASTNDLLTKYFNMLRARNGSADVISIDIVYAAQFAASQWTKPITDSQWPVSEQQKYLPGPLQGCTYQGKIVAYRCWPVVLSHRRRQRRTSDLGRSDYYRAEERFKGQVWLRVAGSPVRGTCL
jgi:multiple sugar transport system substrate-binding protein